MAKMLGSGWLDLNQRPPGSGPGTLTRLRYTQPKQPRVQNGGRGVESNAPNRFWKPIRQPWNMRGQTTPIPGRWRRVRELNPSFHRDRVASMSLDPRGMSLTGGSTRARTETSGIKSPVRCPSRSGSNGLLLVHEATIRTCAPAKRSLGYGQAGSTTPPLVQKWHPNC